MSHGCDVAAWAGVARTIPPTVSSAAAPARAALLTRPVIVGAGTVNLFRSGGVGPRPATAGGPGFGSGSGPGGGFATVRPLAYVCGRKRGAGLSELNVNVNNSVRTTMRPVTVRFTDCRVPSGDS